MEDDLNTMIRSNGTVIVLASWCIIAALFYWVGMSVGKDDGRCKECPLNDKENQ